MKLARKTLSVGLCALLATTPYAPIPAFAEESLPTQSEVSAQMGELSIASGTWGSCPWVIENDGTLTISSGTGASIDDASPWASWSTRITSVRFSGTVTAPDDISGLFRDITTLRTADLTGLNTSATTDFHSLFNGCTALTSVNLGAIDTSKATLLDAMFRNCSSLASVDVSRLDTSACLHFEGMFQGCSSLVSLDLSHFDVSSAEHLEDMFQGCSSLVSLDLSSFDTARGDYFQNMFADCTSLATLDISNFDTTGAVNLSGLFSGCASLSHVRVGNQFSFSGNGSTSCTLPSYGIAGHTDWFSSTAQEWMGADAIASGQNMVYAVYAKTEVPYEADPNPGTGEPGQVTASGTWGSCAWELDDRGTLTIGSGTGARLDDDDPAPWASVAEHVKSVRFDGRVVAPIVTAGLFKNLENATSIDLHGLDVSGVTYLGWFFAGCESLQSIDLSPLNTRSATNMNHFFSGCRSLKTVDLSVLDTSSLKDMGDMFRECSGLERISFEGVNTSRVTYMGDMFYGCSSLAYVDLSPLNMASNTSLSEMFAYCTSLTSVGLSGLDTSNVTRMDGMFTGCSNLKIIDFSGLDTSNVTRFDNLFNGCSKLRCFDASTLDTRSAQNLSYLFCGCTLLTSIDLSSWNTGSATNTANMFRGCERLRYLNLSGLNTSRVTNMAEMFYACPNVISFDLTSFNTRNVQDMHGMFDWCTYTRSIDLSSFDTRSVTNMENMFRDCVKLARVKVGPEFSFAGAGTGSTCALPTTWVDGHTDWYSTADGAWMTSQVIALTRNNISTTYQKSVAAPYIPEQVSSPFVDVPDGAWFADGVNFVACKGLMQGYYEGSEIFGVNDTLTRAQLATILWRLVEPEEYAFYDETIASTPNTTRLIDVEGFAWYTAAANWAVANGVMNGYRDENGVAYAFGPNDPVTFEMMVSIIANLTSNGAAENFPTGELDRFLDKDDVLASWSAHNMAWAASVGLVNGSGGYILPFENTTRARGAAIVFNAFDMGLL